MSSNNEIRQCSICGEIFDSHREALAHCDKSNNNKLFFIAPCTSGFKSCLPSRIRDHIRSCKQCREAFPKGTSLARWDLEAVISAVCGRPRPDKLARVIQPSEAIRNQHAATSATAASQVSLKMFWVVMTHKVCTYPTSPTTSTVDSVHTEEDEAYLVMRALVRKNRPKSIGADEYLNANPPKAIFVLPTRVGYKYWSQAGFMEYVWVEEHDVDHDGESRTQKLLRKSQEVDGSMMEKWAM